MSVHTEVADYLRPSLWPNTPDILTEALQTGGTPAFVARLVLASTLAASYGIYGPAFELLEHVPVEIFDTAQHIASRGPFLVAKEVLPSMRRRGAGSFFFSNNSSSLRGRKRMTGQSLYYPRVMMRTLAQVLTEEYSEHGVHVANVVIDGTIDSPGTRAMPRLQNRPDLIINPVKIADAFWYLHTQDRSCWTHELQLTPSATKPSY